VNWGGEGAKEAWGEARSGDGIGSADGAAR